MNPTTKLGFLFALSVPCLANAADPVAASARSSMPTASGQIRQFAFDGDAESYFQADKAAASDHFTLTFDKPVTIRSVSVTTGKPGGEGKLDAGQLEVSADGEAFGQPQPFVDGALAAKFDGPPIKAIRIKPTKDQDHPLAIREIKIESDPAVAVFRHPVEYTVDVADAPELKEWAEKVALLCEAWYPRLVDELPSDGFKPTQRVKLVLSNDYKGVAAAGGGRITGSVKYYKDHPDDLGSMIHETVHIIQNYRSRRNPGWLVEGLADYIRFFEFEPADAIGPINGARARYNDSYRTSARFLAFVKEKYAPTLITEMNRRMREGRYSDEAFRELTGKDLKELDEEWRATLPRREPRKKAEAN
ncbi:basic secretory protein-like protein [Tundrisphaera sp. TA3]|uniref:basic secretory protein-like protein n=1 Tax=Tundrisphaera sp. TA3 TaxID=3435775 RepID=UPI003EB77EA6